MFNQEQQEAAQAAANKKMDEYRTALPENKGVVFDKMKEFLSLCEENTIPVVMFIQYRPCDNAIQYHTSRDENNKEEKHSWEYMVKSWSFMMKSLQSAANFFSISTLSRIKVYSRKKECNGELIWDFDPYGPNQNCDKESAE